MVPSLFKLCLMRLAIYHHLTPTQCSGKVIVWCSLFYFSLFYLATHNHNHLIRTLSNFRPIELQQINNPLNLLLRSSLPTNLSMPMILMMHLIQIHRRICGPERNFLSCLYLIAGTSLFHASVCNIALYLATAYTLMSYMIFLRICDIASPRSSSKLNLSDKILHLLLTLETHFWWVLCRVVSSFLTVLLLLYFDITFKLYREYSTARQTGTTRLAFVCAPILH